jgi:L-glutamine-phosphate cytidylyltransferase
MKAVILAGGPGTRLLPETEYVPKCMLMVDGKTILEHQLDALEECGIKEIIIITGHKGEMIEDLVGKRAKYVKNEEYKTTAAAYGLWLARNELMGDGFIYLNGDLVFHPNMLRKLLDSEKDGIISCSKVHEHPNDMFKFQANNSRIHHMDKEIDPSLAHGVAIGPAKVSGKGTKIVFELLDKLFESGEKGRSFAYSIFSEMSKQHEFFAIDHEGAPWVEVDTPEDLEKARDEIVKKL